jgi:transcriptional regulator with XRE-family HTH domain
MKAHNDVGQLRQRLDFSQAAMAQVIGVSSRTVSRWEEGSTRPSGLAKEKLEKIEALVELIERYIKQEARAEWLQTPNPAFGGKSPAEVLQSPGGMDRLIEFFRRIEWGITL